MAEKVCETGAERVNSETVVRCAVYVTDELKVGVRLHQE